MEIWVRGDCLGGVERLKELKFPGLFIDVEDGMNGREVVEWTVRHISKQRHWISITIGLDFGIFGGGSSYTVCG